MNQANWKFQDYIGPHLAGVGAVQYTRGEQTRIAIENENDDQIASVIFETSAVEDFLDGFDPSGNDRTYNTARYAVNLQRAIRGEA